MPGIATINHLFSKRALAWSVLCTGIVLSVLASLHVRNTIYEEHEQAFSFACDQVTLKIQERLQLYKLILRGAAGLFQASGKVDRAEWKTYVDHLRTTENIPGIQGVGFARSITPGELENHIAYVRAEGFADYTVFPEGKRDTYSAIIYLEPFEGRNLRAFGYDMLSEPVRRAAMERARDDNRASISGKVKLVQETETDIQAGVLMYVPVYQRGMATGTIAERRAALIGWTYSPYRMNDLMTGILDGWQGKGSEHLDIHIYDGTQASSSALLYDSVNEVSPFDSPFREQRLIDFNGHPWLLEFGRDPAVGINYWPAWFVLAAGATASSLLFALMLSLINRREKAVKIAKGLTADIEKREQLLRESEYRWKFALEGSGDGVWDWDVTAGTVVYSRLWKEMLGFDEQDIGNGLDEWESRVHPDDKGETLALVSACLEGRTPAYISEHRVRCKDGSYKWILDRGMVVARDTSGKPVRMIGTHSDISRQKALEESLRESRVELVEAQRIARVGSWTLNNRSGKVTWTPELYQMFGLDPNLPAIDYTEQSKLFTPESWARLSVAVATAAEGTPYELELETIKTDGSHGWMLARGEAVRDAEGHIEGLRGIATDITERKQAQLRIEHLTRLYAALSQCNSAIVHCDSERQLFIEICRIVVTHGGMKMAWIGLIDESTGRIIPAHAYGHGTEYLDGIEISVRASDPHGRGPTGTAARENRPVWLDDFPSNPATIPWRERAARYGWISSAALPICRGGKPVGALTFYSGESGWYDDEIRSLLVEMAEDISFALDKLNAEKQTKSAHAALLETEQQFRSLVEQSIAGAFIVQDGKFVYTNPRFNEILGYSAEDNLLGKEPTEFIVQRDRAAASERMRKLLACEVEKTEALFTVIRKDGTTVEVGTNSSLATYLQRPAIIGLMQDISDRKMAEAQIKRYGAQLESVFMQTVGLATTLVEMRDPYTAGHVRRVADIAVAIGTEMGLDQTQLEGLRVGGYLHDVGKIVVPAEILTKPGRLTNLEYALVKNHVRAGFDILKDVDFPWPVAQIALQHHERVDGSGYPQGLKGEEIIIEARIVALADVIESMATHRPYRPALGLDKALEEIERGAGTIYDSAVVSACLRLFREKGYQIHL